MKGRVAGGLAALLWTLLCVRWFDVAAPARGHVLDAIPPAVFAVALLASLVVLLRECGRPLSLLPEGGSARELVLVVLLAIAFRLPMAWTAAAGYTTSDGSLSGTVALHVREGVAHRVFVPNVPYSGSLKSHLAAAIGLAVDLQRAFTLTSVLFYALFVAAVYGLASRRVAALYVVFAPAFVTRYSLSNDGNYVEVLALGTLALLWATRVASADDRARNGLAWAAGIALGLAFWCHILAVIHATAVGLVFVLAAPRAARRTLPRLALGFALGMLPSLLWNAANGWESLLYVLPGGQPVGSLAQGPALPARLAGILREHLPVLAGYDLGHTGVLAVGLGAFAALALAMIAIAYTQAIARVVRARETTTLALLVFSAVNLGVAAFGLPYIPWNARYLQFLMAPAAVFLAEAFGTGARRLLFGLLVAGGALTSLAQWPAEAESDARWRAFVADLEKAGVTRAYTDFYLAAKIDFLSEERVLCSSELGPTTTEYFLEYREAVAAAERPALIAVNKTAGEKLERKLQRLGIAYERLDLMKPVILPARRVHPSELFGGS